jgi:hypothetical protein
MINVYAQKEIEMKRRLKKKIDRRKKAIQVLAKKKVTFLFLKF